jgi:hypothetical protein
MAVFWGSFFPLPSWAREVAWLAPLSKNYQLKLSNRHDYDALLADAERLVAQGHKLTVFGFGYDGDDDIISDELFEALEGERSKDWLVRTAHVDRRDRFKIEPLLAHYAIVPDSSLSATLEHPALPPWPPTSQRAAHAHFEQVVVAPAELIRGHRGIGAAYRRLPKEYTISPGVTVHIYEKVRPFTIEEADELLAQFYRLYPEWRGDYAFAEAVLVSSLGSGDREAKVEVELPNNLQIWPDKAVSEQMVIPTEALVRTSARGLVVSVQHKWGRCSDQKDIPVKLDARSGPIWTGNVSAQEQIIHFLGNEGIISLTIGPSQQGCEYLSIHPFLSGP